VTGKPVILGGIPGRREATGRGVAIVAAEALRTLGRDMAGARVIVQGFGNVGSVAAAALASLGARVVGVSDIQAAVYDERGLDIAGLVVHSRASGTVRGCGQGREVPRDALLERECDVLVPAAAGNQITADNAPRIRAALVAEGANGPTTPDADAVLEQRGITVIPDILCNAGGVFVSYLEYTQETQQEQMAEEEVNTRLEKRMKEKFGLVSETAGRGGLRLREAALYLALRSVCQALEAKGALP
jgi:glutamate dehydrogenase (NAD(P)+)